MIQDSYFRVASAIPSVKIGDCLSNIESIERLMREAASQGVEVVLFPELSITGYTCGDLFLHSTLRRSAIEALERLVASTSDLQIVAVVGMPFSIDNNLYNCAAMISGGRVLGVVPKRHIPNYSEFYESRWFASGDNIDEEVVELCGEGVVVSPNSIFAVNGVNCAIEICEDLWVPTPPSSTLCEAAQVIFNLSASPEVVGKYDYLRSLIEQQSARCMAAYVYASAGFGESSTDLVFGGKSIIAENGRVIAEGDRFSFDEHMTIADLDIEMLDHQRLRTTTFHNHKINRFICDPIYFETATREKLMRPVDRMPFVPTAISRRDERCHEIFSIQTNGLAQRLSHTCCKRVVIGISGGLDSTLALLVAVRTFDKLGLDRKGIIGVTMPGFGTTGRTYNNAVTLVNELGATLREISIKAACEQHFSDIGLPSSDRSVSYENSQARERTQILMDIANMESGMVVGTGDLSELALGWATYNGDHMSMYGVNSSVPKTLIRYLVEWIAESEPNAKVAAALRDVADTPVSPELLPADENDRITQKTEDLVGPYELHDFFLYNFVRLGYGAAKIHSLATIAFEGVYDEATITKWLRIFVRRFFNQQFKRSAMPDGPKVGSVTLSPRGDWRMPSDASSAAWLAEVEE